MPDDLDLPPSTRLYLSGIYAPVLEEMTADGLAVVGEIPRDLNGLYLQNGPNPRFAPRLGHSWFDGDGMVQAVGLQDGGVTYRSRFVLTEGLKADLAAGEATHVGSLAMPGAGKRHKNVANTDVVHHAGRLLALWWEGDTPYELSLPDLETKGPFTYGGTLTGEGLTSHAKLDPATGELCFISWGRKAPYLHVGVASDAGRIVRHSAVELPGPRIQHDMALSERFIGVFDFPMRIDLGRSGQQTLGFVFEPDTPARIGLVDRRDAAAPVRWFEVASAFMWHLSSAWDEGDEFVLVGARIAHPTRLDARGGVREHGPIVDGEHRFDARAHMWRLNVRTGAVTERALDDLPIEFPRVNDAHICAGARYSYMVEIAADQPTVKGSGLVKYDLATGARARLAFPPGRSGNEFSFAPRDGGSGEDDGYLVGFVTDEAELRSELWIVPAQALSDGPIARVELPQRVAPKFHGRWIAADKLGGG
jgi:carotenoid cleavage dioxygenase